MKIKLSDFWRLNGTIGRVPYACAGLIGFAIKLCLDRYVAHRFFDRDWDLSNYLVPTGGMHAITSLSKPDAAFFATMLAMSLPFIWVGLALTLRRLRDSGLPSWMVVFFFAPFINLIFFALLSVLPPGASPARSEEEARWNRPPPEEPGGSLGLALILSLVFGVAATALGVSFFKQYGWSLFVGLPFSVGLVAVLVYGSRRSRSCACCVSVALMAVMLYGVVLIGLAMEGLICILMASPIALALAALGGFVGYAIQWRPSGKLATPSLLAILVLATPLLMLAESRRSPAPPLFEVHSSIDVDASPARVWQHVVSFSELPPPTEWFFRAGVAYPKRAEIHGTGPGAERHCVFSTGSFVEPIEVWDEPRLLKFSVTKNPPPMEEWTPYKKIHPPHLEGFLVSRGGQFLLTPLPNGRTRLEGTTWYEHNMWPASYWRIWSDRIIHTIHRRVLRHIQRETERETSSG